MADSKEDVEITEKYDENEVLDFSLVLATKPVFLIDEEDIKTEYYLRELNGTQRDAYLTFMGDKVKYNKKGKFCGLQNYDGLNASLLCRTLFVKSGNASVPVAQLQKMPSQVLTKLFKTAQKMSGLDMEAGEDAGED